MRELSLHHSAFILLPLGARVKWFWQGCKPNSVCVLADGENHLSERPIPETCPLSRTRSGPLLGFQFGLTNGLRRRRSNFLWHCPSKSLSTFRLRVSQPNKPGLRSIAPCGVRTFLPGLAPGAILRPAKTNFNITPKNEKGTKVFSPRALNEIHGLIRRRQFHAAGEI